WGGGGVRGRVRSGAGGAGWGGGSARGGCGGLGGGGFAPGGGGAPSVVGGVRGSAGPWGGGVSRGGRGVVALCAVPRAPESVTYPVQCWGLLGCARFPAPLAG